MDIKAIAEKVLNGYLVEMTKCTEPYKLGIRIRADGVINFCEAAALLNKSEAAEWQGKFIAEFFRFSSFSSPNGGCHS